MRAPACASSQVRRRQRGNACTSAVANAAREAAFAAAINANTHNRRTRERGDAAISAGYRIDTTRDGEVQKKAEKAMRPSSTFNKIIDAK
jgi:membrane peptidoglycan carboxypeptidase